MVDFIKDLKTYLIAQAIDITTNIFLDYLPDTPDTCIAIFEYAGKDHVIMQKRYIQILCRSAVRVTAKSKAEAIKTLLSNSNPEQKVILTAGGLPYIFKSLQLPFFIEKDDRNRFKCVCNYRVI